MSEIQIKNKIDGARFEVKVDPEDQCQALVRILSIPTTPRRGARSLIELHSLIDPIIDATMAGKLSLELEKRLAEVVRAVPWRSVPTRVGDHWEEAPEKEVIVKYEPRAFILFFARRVLVLNQLYRIRRCRLETCRKYFLQTNKTGPAPEFCSIAHRSDYHNPIVNKRERVGKLFLTLAKSASKRDYDLTDAEKKRIAKLGTSEDEARETFGKMRPRLRGLSGKYMLPPETIEELLAYVPEDAREKLTEARPYKKKGKQKPRRKGAEGGRVT